MNLITPQMSASCVFNLFITCSVCRPPPNHIGPQHHQISSPWHPWNRHRCEPASCSVHLPDAGLPVRRQPGYHYWGGCRWPFIPHPPADPWRGVLHAAASDLQRRLLHQTVPGTLRHAEGVSDRRAAASRAAGGLRRQDEQGQPGPETQTRGRHHLPRLHTWTQGQRWLGRQGGHTYRPQRGKLLPRSLPHPKHAPLRAPCAQPQQRLPLSSGGLLRQRYRQRLRVPHGWVRDLTQRVVCLRKGAKRKKNATNSKVTGETLKVTSVLTKDGAHCWTFLLCLDCNLSTLRTWILITVFRGATNKLGRLSGLLLNYIHGTHIRCSDPLSIYTPDWAVPDKPHPFGGIFERNGLMIAQCLHTPVKILMAVISI